MSPIVSGGGSGGSPSVTVAASVPVSSAQILALKDSFVVLVAAPGLGKTLVPVFAVIEYLYGTVAYTCTDPDPAWSVGSGNFAGLIGFHPAYFIQDAAENGLGVGQPNNGVGAPTASFFNNKPLLLANQTATNYANGDGTLAVTVGYYTLTLS